MRILLQNITREPEKDRVLITVQFGDEPPKQYLGSVDAGDEKFKGFFTEQELFMRLSKLAGKKYCNCAIYQMELMDIILAFFSGQDIPPFPIELGTTSFGLPRPSRGCILFHRVTRPFHIAWLWWDLRHIRRENRLR